MNVRVSDPAFAPALVAALRREHVVANERRGGVVDVAHPDRDDDAKRLLVLWLLRWQSRHDGVTAEVVRSSS